MSAAVGGEEDDWGDDFDGASSTKLARRSTASTGDCDDWGDDFDLSEAPTRKPPGVAAKTRTSAIAPAVAVSSVEQHRWGDELDSDDTSTAGTIRKLMQLLEPIEFSQHEYEDYIYHTAPSAGSSTLQPHSPHDEPALSSGELDEQRQLLEWRLAFAKGKRDAVDECTALAALTKLYRRANLHDAAVRHLDDALSCLQRIKLDAGQRR